MRTCLLDDGSHLHFHDLPGEGTPLLFIHGLGCASSCDYPGVADHPALRVRRRILLDLLGSGFSDRPEGFAYSVEAHAATVVALVGHLGLEALHVYGHSMGGAVAIEVAQTIASKVTTLVLSEPNLDPGGGLFSRGIAATSAADYLASGHAQVVREAAAAGNQVWAGSMRTSSPCAVHGGARSLVEGSDPTWRAQLLSLDMPRVVLFGEQSLPDPDYAALPGQGVAVAVVPNAGHSMAWDNPAGLAAAIASACERARP